MDGFTPRCRTLGEAWRWWAETTDGLNDAAWATPTRLPGWDVAALVAHASLLVRAMRYFSTHPLDAEPTTPSAREMLTRFNEPEGLATTFADTVADIARRDAASMTHAELVAVFAVTAPEVLSAVEQQGPIVIDYFGNGTIPIAEAMSIATLEAVVHGLDLAVAVDLPGASIPGAAMRQTVDLLASLADPVAFVEAATGRTSEAILPVLR